MTNVLYTLYYPTYAAWFDWSKVIRIESDVMIVESFPVLVSVEVKVDMVGQVHNGIEVRFFIFRNVGNGKIIIDHDVVYFYLDTLV